MTRILGVLGLLLVLYAVLFGTHEKAGSFGNLIDVANYQGRYGLITLGAALVIITGGIDLSIGSVLGCAAILFGILMMDGVHPYAAVPLVVLFGCGIGLINGILVTRVRLQPFLVTLCGMFIIRGIARIIAQPNPHRGTVSFNNVCTAHPSFDGPLRSLRYWLIGQSPEDAALIFPAQFILLLVLALVVGFFLHRTAYGRYWYAIGHSELAAKYAGVNVNRHRVVVYVACSALAALVGVLLFLKESSVQSDNAGVGWELYAILGAVLGGCSLRGGEGTAVGMVLGAMVLPVIESIVNYRGEKSDVIPFIVGVTLLIGTIVDELIRAPVARPQVTAVQTNPYDKVARFGAKLDPTEFLTWVLGLPADRLGFGGWLDTRAVPLPGEPDQIGDTVARLDRLEGGEPWAVAVEFQIEPDPLMFGRLMSYLSQLWQTLKPDPERGSRFQVGAAVLNLTEVGNTSRDMRLPGTPLVTQLVVAERNLARESADDTVSKIEAGVLGRSLLPWVPLMAGGGEETIIDRWKKLAEQEPSNRRRSEFGSLALVFAEAADRREQWELGLKGWNVKESVVVNRWIAEGKAEGKAEGEASSVLAVLEEKFGTVPEDLANAIRTCTDSTKLRQWLGAAVRAESLGAFRAAAGI